MADYKSSILLGINLESKDSVNGKLQNLINSLNNTKINLDINIVNSDVAKQLETLTTLANNFKNSLGGNINLGNVNEVIKQAMSSMEKLNGEVLKTNVRAFDDIVSVTQNVSTNLNEVTKQTQKFQKMGEDLKPFGQSITTVTEDVQKLNSTLGNIKNAQKSLDGLKSNGLINTESIDKLKADLNTLYEGINNRKETGLKFNENDIKLYLEQVKQLENEEKNLIQLQNEENELNTKLNNGEFINNQKTAYSNLNQLLTEEFSIKQKLITAEGEYKTKLEESLTNNKLLQDYQNKNINDNNLNNLQKEIELENQRNQLQEQFSLLQAKNNDKINANDLKTEQEKEQILLKQEEAYRQIDVLKNNGIINGNDISNLEKMTQEAQSLKEINSVLKSIMSTSMMKESSIVTFSKQIEDAQLQLTKMKQSFGDKLPSGFIQAIETQLNELKTNLKSTDELGFNGLKNNLNNIKTEMAQVSNETKQLINSLKETNNSSLFSSFSNFLAQTGIFYGTIQVVQEIKNQLKEATNYIVEMDKSMTNMQMITGKSKGEITSIVNDYKQLGEQLHTTNSEMMKGMEEVTRAGFDGKEGQSLMSASIMGSKLSGQTTAQVTEQLIAIKNAFNMTGEGMQHVVDMMSKMDNVSATSFSEIASAIQRTAFSAQEAGTPLSNLITYITTVSEKTRRSADTIGESFKTIYSRYSNIKLGRLDDDGKSINDTEQVMNRIGIAIRTNKGQFKEFDTVLQEFMQKFKSGQLTQVDYLAGIQALAGNSAPYVEKSA